MRLDLGLLTFSFSAGVAAFFNPCGFALLPSYVSYYLGTGQATPSWWVGLSRGLRLGLVVSAGFLVVFAVLGVVLSLIGGLIGRYLPWIASAIGVALIGLGAALLFGKSLGLPWHPDALLRSHLERHRARQGLAFYFFYGMSYALASISCTVPIFIMVVAQAFSGGTLNGIVNFAAYGLGMTAMMLALSVAMSVSKRAIERFFRPLTRWLQPASALVLIGAGAYLIYYNLFYSGVVWR